MQDKKQFNWFNDEAMTARRNTLGGNARRSVYCKSAAMAIAVATLFRPDLTQGQQPDAPRINFLLLVAEDMGTQLGCYGDPHARTPNIDRLAGESVRFNNAYVTAASCSPSRASILTGLYPQQHGQIGLSVSYSSRRKLVSMKDGIVAFPQVLRTNGYKTGVLGKIHVDPHDRLGFDYRRGSDEDGVSRQSLAELPVIRTDGSKRMTRVRYSADVEQMTRDAREFFAASGGAPFCLMVNFSDAHQPYYNQVNGYPAKLHQPREFTEPFPFTGQAILDAATRREMAAYYNCIARLDASVGQILGALDEAGLTAQTMVILLSDHGPEGFGRAKLSNYEAGLKVPFLLKHPGQKLPRTFDGFVSSLDLMPTVLGAAQIACSASLPGKSLLKVVAGLEKPHEEIFGEFNRHLDDRIWPIRSVRLKDFKLIHYPFAEVYQPLAGVDAVAQRAGLARQYLEYAQTPGWEFFNLKQDPHELNNLADDPRYRRAFQECQRRLRQWQEAVSDFLLNPTATENEKRLVNENIRKAFGSLPGKK